MERAKNWFEGYKERYAALRSLHEPLYPSVDGATGTERAQQLDSVRKILEKPEGLVSPDLHTLNEAFIALLGLQEIKRPYHGMAFRTSNHFRVASIDDPKRTAEVYFRRNIHDGSTSLNLKHDGKNVIESVEADPKKKKTALVSFRRVFVDGSREQSFILGREMPDTRHDTVPLKVSTNEVRGIYERSLVAIENPSRPSWHGLRRLLPRR